VGDGRGGSNPARKNLFLTETPAAADQRRRDREASAKHVVEPAAADDGIARSAAGGDDYAASAVDEDVAGVTAGREGYAAADEDRRGYTSTATDKENAAAGDGGGGSNPAGQHDFRAAARGANQPSAAGNGATYQRRRDREAPGRDGLEATGIDYRAAIDSARG